MVVTMETSKVATVSRHVEEDMEKEEEEEEVRKRENNYVNLPKLLDIFAYMYAEQCCLF